MNASQALKVVWLLPVLLLLLPAVVQAQDAYSTNTDGSIYTYSTNADGSANIVAYTGPPWVVTIPTNINGLTVTTIGTNAFYNYTSLTSVTIPNSVTSIGTYAFAYCYGLTGVTIPNSVTNIGVEAFVDCINLATITVDVQNSFFSSTNGVLFNKNQTTLVEFPENQGVSYTIPNSVTSIGPDAFYDCTSLTNVIIGTNFTNIGDSAFANCFSLANVIIPNGVTNIGVGAFSACNSLTNIIIPNGVTSIENESFVGSGLISVTIGTNVTSIGTNAFSCFSLTSVIIPNSVTSIEYGAFFDCDSLTSVTIGTNVANIGNNAFFHCFLLTNVTIPSSVTNIGNAAFSDCANLATITVDGQNSFYSSTNGVLFNKNQTTLVQFPGHQGGSYTIPNGVTNIEDYAFGYCLLTNVTIPNSVANIGNYAFEYCNHLAQIYFQGDAPAIGASAFSIGPLGPVVYKLPGTTGWGSSLGGVRVILWNPRATTFSVTGGHFGFNIAGLTNAVIVVEASTNLVNPVWLPVATNTMSSSGTSSFNDPQWTNYPSRFYRLRSP